MLPKRIVIIAENASDKMGGEAILPCHYFREFLDRGIDVQLVTHERSREDLHRQFPQHIDRFHFARDKFSQKMLFRGSRKLPQRLRDSVISLSIEMLTQRSLRHIARSLMSRHSIAFQPVPVAPRAPSLMHKMGGPVVIGPMNGNMQFPPAFRSATPAWQRGIVGSLRWVAGHSRHVFAGKSNAAMLLVANERTREALHPSMASRARVLVENGVLLDQWPARTAVSAVPRFLFVGRLVDWKGLDLAIQATAAVPGAILDVIGDGPMRGSCEQLARDLGIADRVHFLGWLAQTECASAMRESQALLLPSLFECGGAVVLEAMASAIPVIAVNWGGPTDYLDATTGFLVQPTSREGIVDAFAVAMQRILDHPRAAASMGAHARRRIEQSHTWSAKAEQVLKLMEKLY